MNEKFASARLVATQSSLPIFQAGALIFVWWVAQQMTLAFNLPLPGSLVGLMALWLMLDSKILPVQWFEKGADGLLNHLMLFFAPAMLALVDHPELLSMLGIKLLAAVLLGTVIVMCGTAFVVELAFRFLYAPAR